jgi:putative PIN family toxin of toxin-antitoxin system
MTGDEPTRIVLDTNTLVSAYLFPSSIPGQALDIVLAKHRLLMSFELASELTDVMRREKFDCILSLQRRDELVASTVRESDFQVVSTVIKACRDTRDNKVLELAVDGRASAIVTGDADLLVMHPFRGIAILTPRDFLLRFEAQ